MPDRRRAYCRRCGKHRSSVGLISWDGNCRKCGRLAMHANNDEISAHSGPGFARWRAGMAACVGVVLLDDSRMSTQTGDHAA